MLPEDALQDYLNSNPLAKRSKHGELSAACTRELKQLHTEHTEQQTKYDKARALLAAELGYEPNEPLRCSEIAELVGTGYDDLKVHEFTHSANSHRLALDFRFYVNIMVRTRCIIITTISNMLCNVSFQGSINYILWRLHPN